MANRNSDFWNRRLSIQDIEAPYSSRFVNSIKSGGRQMSGHMLYDFLDSNSWFGEDDSPKIAPEDMKSMADEQGVHFNWLEYKPGPMTQRQAQRRIDRQRDLNILRENVAAGRSGFLGNAGLFVGQFLGSFTDPLELALSIVPVEKTITIARSLGRSADFAASVAQAQRNSRVAESMLARTGGRFAEGARDAAIANAVFEPFYAYMAQDLGDEYGFMDFAANVGLGGVLGGTLRSIGGALGDWRRGMLSRDPEVRRAAFDNYRSRFTPDIQRFESDPLVKDARLLSGYDGFARAMSMPHLANDVFNSASVFRNMPEQQRQRLMSDMSDAITLSDGIRRGEFTMDGRGVIRTKEGEILGASPETKQISDFITKHENAPGRVGELIRDLGDTLTRNEPKGVERFMAVKQAVEKADAAPPNAREQVAKVSDQTRMQALQVALTQANNDRMIDVAAILGADPVNNTATRSDIERAGQRSGSFESSPFYDREAVERMKNPPDLRPENPTQTLSNAYDRREEARQNYEDARSAYQASVQYSRGEAPAQRATVDSVHTAARETFGESTQKLMDAGMVKVVDRVADLPGGGHPPDVKAATFPDGRVYLVAENITPSEVKGLVLHEVGAHVGIPRILGDKAYGALMQQVDSAVRRGDQWAVDARASVPESTPRHLINDEILGYTVQRNPDLPFVKNLVAKVRAWLFRNFDIARRFLKLNENDISALAISALRRIDPQTVTLRNGQDIFYSQGAFADAPFEQAIESLNTRIDQIGRLRAALKEAASLSGRVDDIASHVRETLKDVDPALMDEVLGDIGRRSEEIRAGQAKVEQAQNATQAAIDDLTIELEQAAVIEQRNRYMNEAKHYELKQLVNEFRKDTVASKAQEGAEPAGFFEKRRETAQEKYRQDMDNSAFTAMLVGTSDAKRGAKLSVDAIQQQERNRLQGYLINGLESRGLLKAFLDSANEAAIYDALHTIGRNGDVSRIPNDMAEIARVIINAQEQARLTMNAEGAWIRKLDDYIAPQSHDIFKLRGKTYEQYRDIVLPLLDTERTFTSRGVTNIDASLRAIYQNLRDGVHEKAGDPVGAAAFGSGSSVARRASQHRLLHFKDGASAFEYNHKFGNGSLVGSVTAGLDHAAKNIGLMRKLGTNPQHAFNRIFDETVNTLRAEDASRAANLLNQRHRFENMMHEVDGSTNIPANETLARVAGNWRGVQSMARLGGAAISSISDLAVYASSLRFISGDEQGLFRGSLDGLAGVVKGARSQTRKEILRAIGFASNSILGEMYNRFDAPDMVSGGVARGMRLFFKLNGLTPWTENLKQSWLISVSHILAERTGREFADLGDTTRTALEWYGIDSDMWNVLRHAAMTADDGGRYLVPEAIRTIPDSVIADYVRARGLEVTSRALDEARSGIRSTYHTFLINEMNAAVIEPGAKSRVTLFQGTQRGTVTGETARFVGQFKMFPIAVLQLAAGREIYGRGFKSVGDFVLHGRSAYGSMVSFMVLSTMLGYVAMTIKDLLRGKNPRDPSDPKTFAAAFVQGGGAGIFGDFLFGEYNRFGSGLTSTLAGPTFGLADDVANIYSRVRNGDDAAAKIFSTALNNTPYANLFYTRPVLNYLFLNQMQEALNPGSLQRSRERVQRDTGQSFWMQPDAMLF